MKGRHCLHDANKTSDEDSEKQACCMIMNLTSFSPWFLQSTLNSWNFPRGNIFDIHEPQGPYLSCANKMLRVGLATPEIMGLEGWSFESGEVSGPPLGRGEGMKSE